MYKIGLLKGDYAGPEGMKEAIKVLDACSKKHKFEYMIEELLASGEAYDIYQNHLPQITIDKAKTCDALLKGPFGGPASEVNDPKWQNVEKEAILPLRKIFNFYTNLREIKVYDSLMMLSPVKEKVIKGVDFVIVRELTSGIYFGKKEAVIENGERVYSDTESYSESEIKRIAIKAFDLAMKRDKRVTLIAKSNVMKSSVLWREVVNDVKRSYPDVTLSYLHVDNASMQIILNPRQFDVILTSNIFGDILSDEASVLSGSIGMCASASIGDTDFGLYEPIHGSAPEIAGKNIINPISSILCVAYMMRYSFKREDVAKDIEDSIDKVLKSGYRTIDIYDSESGHILLGTKEMGDAIAEAILK